MSFARRSTVTASGTASATTVSTSRYANAASRRPRSVTRRAPRAPRTGSRRRARCGCSAARRRRRPGGGASAATCTSSVFVDPNQSTPHTSSISLERASTVPAFAMSVCSRSNSRRGSSSGSPAWRGRVPAGVELDVAHLDGRRRRRGRGRRGALAGAAQHGADAGDELGHAERLHQVVVGAELEADDAVGLEAAGGEHDDRHLRRRADGAADVAPVDVGQPQVEQDDVGLGPAHRLDARGAGRRQLDPEALALERRAQRIRDRRLVLDHDHLPTPHRGRPLPCRVHWRGSLGWGEAGALWPASLPGAAQVVCAPLSTAAIRCA